MADAKDATKEAPGDGSTSATCYPPMNKRQVMVGDVRQQTAFCDASRPVVIVSDDETLRDLKVVEVYPDTVGGEGDLQATFKIKVRRVE